MNASQLEFSSFRLRQQIQMRCAKEIKKGWIDLRQRWLGSYYSKEIQRGENPVLDLRILWLGPILGFGVVTEKEIPKRTYIGEYMGVVRKRRLFGEKKNVYCFDYTFGAERDTPYVIDAQERGNFARYINHSEQANVETASVFCNGCMHIILYALEEIPAGAELRYDYGPDYWRHRKSPKL